MSNFEAVEEHSGNDNFFTSIYERDYDGLLIARCNQNGAHPWQVQAILNGLNGKKASADLLTEQVALIRDLVAALGEMVDWADYGFDLSDAKAALAKARAAGYEPTTAS